MRKIRLYGMAVAAALAMSIGLIAAGPQLASASASAPAHATIAAGCFGFSCHGHDPVVEGCSVSATNAQSFALATVWNRYSGNCNANWARGQLSASALANHDTIQVAINTDSDSHGMSEFMCVPGPSNTGAQNEYCTGNYGGSNIIYSDMTDGTNLTQAIAYVYNQIGRLIATYVVSF